MLNRFKTSAATPPTRGPVRGHQAESQAIAPRPSALGLRLMPWLTSVLWAGLAYSMVAWGLVWFEPKETDIQVHSLDTVEMTSKPLDTQALSLALGATAAVAPQLAQTPDLSALSAARMHLTGVIYAKPQALGVAGWAGMAVHARNSPALALLSVDEHPPKAFHLGDQIEPGLYLVAIEPRAVKLGPAPHGEAALTLSLPALPGMQTP